MGYPAEIRERVGRWLMGQRRQGARWTDLADKIGISSSCAQNWATRTERAAPALLPVQIVSGLCTKTSPAVLISPAGFRVEGLSIDDLAALLGQLR